MNLLNTAITETAHGDLLIVWGGRRIVTQCLTPPLIEGSSDPLFERVMKRRYRWDNGNMVITRIYDNLTKRRDYVGFFGRNPAIIKDITGRIWIGCRIPVISSQDPMGALSREYVVPRNIGTTAGLNYWEMLRGDELTLLPYKYPFDWQEQVGIPVKTLTQQLPEDITNIDELLAQLGDKDSGITGDTTMEMFSDWTEHRMTGELILRGMGANIMDTDNPNRWHWNEKEGLSREYTTAIYDLSGRQVRYRADDTIFQSHSDKWDRFEASEIQPKHKYGVSGNIKQNQWGQTYIAGFTDTDTEIPYRIEINGQIQTREQPKKQQEFAELWAVDNDRKWVYENAKVPSESYFSWEEPPTPDQQAEITNSLTKYYYALPTLDKQKPSMVISENTGQIVLAWMHGNLTAIPTGQDRYKFVGLRVAISNDNGRTFEPLIPHREN